MIWQNNIKMALFGGIILALVACAGTQDKAYKEGPLSQDSHKLQRVGENYLAAGNYALALKYLKAAEAKGNKTAELYYDLALAYQGRGFSDESINYLRQALSIRPDYPEAHNALGAILAEKGRTDEAIREFMAALENPFYETPQYAAYNLANLYYREGNYKKAEEYYRQAIQFAPNYAKAHLELGRVLEAKGDKKGAYTEYEEAVQYNPQLAEAHFNYGRLCLQFGNYISARYSFEQTIKLAPDSDLARTAENYLRQLGNASLRGMNP